MSINRPNILMIVADDQRADTIGALGNPTVRTPTLDRLVQEGTAFTQAYCTVPICTPARAEILTGRHSFANGVTWFSHPIDPELTLLPAHLSGHGYHSVHVGKWHNDGHPRDRGFSQTRCVFHHDNQAAYAQHGKQVVFDDEHGRVSGHATEVFVDAALDELERAPDDRPLFLYLALISPHDPFDSPEPFASMYSPDDTPLPDNYMPQHPFDNGEMQIRDELLEPWPRTQDAMRRYRACYHGLISHHDAQIGRLLHQLEASGQLDHTIVLFTSDHGLAVGSHGLLGKENMYEHSMRIPQVWCGPGVPRGRQCGHLAHHVDLIPTLCRLAGIERPDTAADGFDLMAMLQADRPVREQMYGAFRRPQDHYSRSTGVCGADPGVAETQRMIRDGRWKLVFYPHLSRFQLFDLDADPHEMRDLCESWRYLGPEEIKRRSNWSAPEAAPLPTQDDVVKTVQAMQEQMRNHMKAIDDPALPLLPAPA